MTSIVDGDYFDKNQQIDITFKKFIFNTTSLDTANEHFEERMDLNQRPIILPTQIWSDGIPDTAPEFQWEDSEIGTFGNPIPGITTPSDYSYIKRYVKIETEVVIGSDSQSYYSDSLVNCIPFFHDPSTGTYLGTLYRNDGTTEIPYGPSGGNWIIDYSSGIITFHDYNTVSSYVDSDNPPVITFIKYDGTTGLVPGVTSAPVTDVPVYNGGASSGSADDLSSIIIDDRDLSSLSSSDFSRAIQIGGNNEGSWRLTVLGSTLASDTQLALQKRTSTADTWQTIHLFQ